MSEYGAFVTIANSNNYFFKNASNNDLLFYTETSNQNMLFGTRSNDHAVMYINSNTMTVSGNLTITSNMILTNQPKFRGIQISQYATNVPANFTQSILAFPGYSNSNNNTTLNIGADNFNYLNVNNGTTELFNISSTGIVNIPNKLSFSNNAVSLQLNSDDKLVQVDEIAQQKLLIPGYGMYNGDDPLIGNYGPVLSTNCTHSTHVLINQIPAGTPSLALSGTGPLNVSYGSTYTTKDTFGNIFMLTHNLENTTTIIYHMNGNASTLTVPASSYYLVKYNSDGIAKWVSYVNSSTIINFGGLCTDTSGDIYTVFDGRDVQVYNSNNTFATTLAAHATRSTARLVKFNSEGMYQWNTSLRSTDGKTNAYPINASVTPDGVIMLARYNGTDPYVVVNSNGINSINITSVNSANNSSVIIKFNSAGIVEWAAKVVSSISSAATLLNNVSCDTYGNLYVSGITNCSCTFYNNNNTISDKVISSAIASVSNPAAFVAKYSSTGVVQWVSAISTGPITTTINRNTIPYWTCAIDTTNNNVYLTGHAVGPTYAYASISSVTTALQISYANANELNGFLVKFNSTGVAQWGTWLSGANTMMGISAHSDKVNLCGTYRNTTLLLSGPANASTAVQYSAAVNTDTFFAVYSASGSPESVNVIVSSGTGSSEAGSLFVDKNTGEVFISGRYIAPTIRPTLNARILLPIATNANAFVVRYCTVAMTYPYLLLSNLNSDHNGKSRTIINQSTTTANINVYSANFTSLLYTFNIPSGSATNIVWNNTFWTSKGTFLGNINVSNITLSNNNWIGMSNNHLSYETTTEHVFYKTTSELMRITSDGIGIGTSSPACPLDISGFSTKLVSQNSTFFDAFSTNIQNISNTDKDVSIKASDNIWASGFIAYSDARIKKNITPLSIDKNVFSQLKPVTYQYIDFVDKGVSSISGLIAQDVKLLYPDLVTSGSNYIPSIYKFTSAILDNKLIIMAHELSVDDIILFIDEDNNTDFASVVEVIDDNSIIIDKVCNKNKLFIFGKLVHDFMSISYDRFIPLLIKHAQDVDLENQRLSVLVASLESRLTTLENK